MLVRVPKVGQRKLGIVCVFGHGFGVLARCRVDVRRGTMAVGRELLVRLVPQQVGFLLWRLATVLLRKETTVRRVNVYELVALLQ